MFLLTRNFLIFLFFLFFSSFFWLLLTLNDDYSKEFSVPLRLKNVPEDVVITTSLPQLLKVSVRDKGGMILKYMFSGNLSPVTVDFMAYNDRNGYVSFLSSDLLKQVSADFSSTARIVSIRPDSVDFFFNHGLCKKVPVRMTGSIETAPQYYLSKVRFSPDSVLVYAVKEQLDTITAAYTRMISYRNLSDSISFVSRLKSVRGAKFVPSLVRTHLSIDQFTEKTVEVPVQGVNFPASKQLRTFPSRVEVTFQVGITQYKRISPNDFVIAISYEELLDNKTNRTSLHLRSIPVGATHVRIQPSEVEYLIEDMVGDADE